MLQRFLPRFCSASRVDAQIAPTFATKYGEAQDSAARSGADISDDKASASNMGVVRIKPKPGDDAIIHAQKATSIEDEIFLFALDLDPDIRFMSTVHRPQLDPVSKQPQFVDLTAGDELSGYKYEPSSSYEFTTSLVMMIRAAVLKQQLTQGDQKQKSQAVPPAATGALRLKALGVGKSSKNSRAAQPPSAPTGETSAQSVVASVKILAHLLTTYQEFLQRRSDSIRNDIYQLVGSGDSADHMDESTVDAYHNSLHRGNFFESPTKALIIAVSHTILLTTHTFS